MLDKPCVPGLAPPNQPYYQPVQDCTYWMVYGVFNNWNIVTFSNKNTTGEDFEEIHQVVLDGISDNMDSLVQSVKCVAMIKKYPKKMFYYVLKCVSDA